MGNMGDTSVEEAGNPEHFLFRAGLELQWACGKVRSGSLHQVCLQDLWLAFLQHWTGA